MDFQRVADIINRVNPEVVALQELDNATQRSGKKIVLYKLAIRTNLYPIFGASISYEGGKYSIGILTKEKPVFLAGDLNADTGSVVVKNLVPGWLFLNHRDEPTIPADNPKRCIGYILALKSNICSYFVEESVAEEEAVASDHLPVWFRVSMEK